VDFSDFDTESGSDTVKVCDGAYCVPDTVIAELSGQLDARTLRYQSTGKAMTLSFPLTESSVVEGFKLATLSSQLLLFQVVCYL